MKNTISTCIAFVLIALTVACAPTPTTLPTSAPSTTTFELVLTIKGDSMPFKLPTGLAVDKQGNLYVLDTGNSRVVKFDSTGKSITTWGTPGEGDGQFNVNYRGGGRIAVDGQGNVYVTGANYRIQKFDNNGKFLTKWGSQGDGDSQFSSRVYVAVDKRGDVYTSEYENHRVEKFDSNGKLLFTLGGWNTGDAEFFSPVGISVDQNDNMYVAEQLNSRIRKFSRDGKALAKFFIPLIADKVISPYVLTIDVQDNFYIVDNKASRVVKLDSSGNFIAALENPKTGDNQFEDPWAVAVDAQGNMYVSDGSGGRVQKFKQK